MFSFLAIFGSDLDHMLSRPVNKVALRTESQKARGRRSVMSEQGTPQWAACWDFTAPWINVNFISRQRTGNFCLVFKDRTMAPNIPQ